MININDNIFSTVIQSIPHNYKFITINTTENTITLYTYDIEKIIITIRYPSFTYVDNDKNRDNGRDDRDDYLKDDNNNITNNHITTNDITNNITTNNTITNTNSYFITEDNLSTTLYSSTDRTITIDFKTLLKYIKFYKNNYSIQISDKLHFIKCDNNKEMVCSIPLIQTKNIEYGINGKIFIKCILDYKILESLMLFSSYVVYEINNNKMVVRRKINTGEDILTFNNIKIINNIRQSDISDINDIRRSEVYFKCNNEWIKMYQSLKKIVKLVLLEFRDDVLRVQFMLKDEVNSVEIFVPKVI
ncbi:hypothetical protein SLOPH_1751 [Spraguea lophii 42_110]|uniref:Uncharacterized protein n=1 Tax=Spraguea lophii (strain 42_110) TaxID=1358809 RepID=S7W6E6_SPRLO|nr:hypothetical protein SLOPH_1751 [Spraguea lophii 42_110]